MRRRLIAVATVVIAVAGLSLPERTNAASYYDHEPALAVDAAGNVHLAWIREGDAGGLYYATNATGAWSARPIATTGQEGRPRVGVDASGNVHIIFDHRPDRPDPGIYYATNKSGEWRVERLVRDPVVGQASFVLDTSGWLHVVWAGVYDGFGGLFYLTNRRGVTRVVKIRSEGGSGPEIAIGTDQAVHVVFAVGSNTDPLHCDIGYITNQGGSWQPASGFGLSRCYINSPRVGIDAQGKVRAVYGVSDSSIWEWTLHVPHSGRVLVEGASRQFASAFSPNGLPHVVHMRPDLLGDHTRDVWVTRGTDPPQATLAVDRGSTIEPRPVVAVGPDGASHIAYRDQDAGPHIIYATDASGTWTVRNETFPVSGSAAALTSITSAPKMGARLTTSGGIPVLTAWLPNHAAITGYEVQRSTDSSSFTPVGSMTTPSVTQTLTKAHRYQYSVRALYGTSAVSAWAAGAAATVRLIQEKSTRLAYGGTWTRKAISGASGGYVRSTTQAGAYVRFSVTGNAAALVATMGPKFGRVDVYVDGTFHSRVDLYRSVASTRRIVWSAHFADARQREIRVVLRATSGRQRFDLDAFAVFE